MQIHGTDRHFANSPLIYIGKESDKHLEEAEDLSLLEFKAVQYTPKGNAVADEEQLARIGKIPKREFIRRGVNQHTLEKSASVNLCGQSSWPSV